MMNPTELAARTYNARIARRVEHVLDASDTRGSAHWHVVAGREIDDTFKGLATRIRTATSVEAAGLVVEQAFQAVVELQAAERHDESQLAIGYLQDAMADRLVLA